MIPEMPDHPPLASGTARMHVRYEDVAQDGSMQLASMMQGLGAAVWRHIPVMDAWRTAGILPILSRLVLVAGASPISVHGPVEYSGAAFFAREDGGDRLFLNMWLEARAQLGKTYGPNPVGEPEVVGRAFAEHIVTKPFAPAGERRVTELPGGPEPTLLHPFVNAESLLEGAELASLGEVTFGMMHTDSNQHVNSLVYPRLFEERAPGNAQLAREIEMRYRKPFFLCDRAEIRGSTDGRGCFASPGALKPNCTIRLSFA